MKEGDFMGFKVLLVRHGMTKANIKRRYEGKGDSLLSEEGVEQAARLADSLSSLDISMVYSSPKKRCVQTGEAIAKPHGLSVKVVPGLEEVDFGLWEGLTFDEIQERDRDLVSKWIEDPVRIRPPHGETLEEMASRVFRAYNEICALHARENAGQSDTRKASQIVVVTHGGPIRAILSQIEKGNLSGFWDYSVPPCSVVEAGGTVLFASPS